MVEPEQMMQKDGNSGSSVVRSEAITVPHLQASRKEENCWYGQDWSIYSASTQSRYAQGNCKTGSKEDGAEEEADGAIETRCAG